MGASDGINTENASFLGLPIELRLRIYTELLVSRTPNEVIGYDFSKLPAEPIHGSSRQWISLDGFLDTTDRNLPRGIWRDIRGGTRRRSHLNIDPRILRVCKQINNEACSILYCWNVFYGKDVSSVLYFFERIGERNLGFLRSLFIRVELLHYERNEVPDWLRVLRILASKALGLRHMVVRFHLSMCWGGAQPDHRDFDIASFIRGLAEIRELRGLDLEHYYAQNWVHFLSQAMPQTQVFGVSRLDDYPRLSVKGYSSWLCSQLRSRNKSTDVGLFDQSGNRTARGGLVYFENLKGIAPFHVHSFAQTERASEEEQDRIWVRMRHETSLLAPNLAWLTRFEHRVEHLSLQCNAVEAATCAPYQHSELRKMPFSIAR